jgi:hypothetical protein
LTNLLSAASKVAKFSAIASIAALVVIGIQLYLSPFTMGSRDRSHRCDSIKIGSDAKSFEDLLQGRWSINRVDYSKREIDVSFPESNCVIEIADGRVTRVQVVAPGISY